MARNKLANQVNKQRAECRDHRRVEDGGVETREILAGGASPSAQLGPRTLGGSPPEAVAGRTAPAGVAGAGSRVGRDREGVGRQSRGIA
jgi:hypothetical protein